MTSQRNKKLIKHDKKQGQSQVVKCCNRTSQNTQKNCIFSGEFMKMLIERTNNNQITITVSSSVDSFGLQRLIDYIKYLETTAKSKAKQMEVDKLADEVNSTWWKKNSKRFIK